MFKELKEFLLGGGAFDLAIAVVLATAFGQVISALVEGIITPLIAKVAGQEDPLNFILFDTINIGLVLNAILNFIIVGTILFFIVRAVNKTMKMPGAPTPPDVSLLGEIRDILSGAAKK